MSTELTIIALCGMVLLAFGSLAWWGVRQQRQVDQFLDEYQRTIDGALDALAAVTAERDALRKQLSDMEGEL